MKCLTAILFLLLGTAIAQPQLLTPQDDVELMSPVPVFSWTPATFANAAYSVYIVEVLDGQTPQQASVTNPTIWFSTPSLSLTVTYGGMPALQAGKTYAWYVQATSVGEPFQEERSEVFSFSIPDEETPEQPETSSAQYYLLDPDRKHNAIPLSGNQLAIVLKSYCVDTDLSYALSTNNESVTVPDFPSEITSGNNYLNLDISNLSNGAYRLEIKNTCNQSWIVNFVKR